MIVVERHTYPQLFLHHRAAMLQIDILVLFERQLTVAT